MKTIKEYLEIAKLALMDSSYFEKITKDNYAYKSELLGAFEYLLEHHFISKKFQVPLYLFILNHRTFLEITAPKIAFCGDTHIGHASHDIEAIHAFYQFCLSQDIYTVFHLGDTLDGRYRLNPFENEESMLQAKKVEEEQLSLFHKIYPDFIYTFSIGGNHECWFEHFDPNFVSKVKSYFFDFLGYGSCYIKWNDFILLLKHEIPDSIYHISDSYPRDLCVCGHTHNYSFNNDIKQVWVPALSRVLNRNDISRKYPGFMVLVANGQHIQQQVYYIRKGEVQMHRSLTLK